MGIRELRVENFRGIRHLKWRPQSAVCCLVGPGDSTKSTILDAIECVLSPRWNLTFTDSDFFDCNVDQPFAITAIVDQVPESLGDDARFGLKFQGWDERLGVVAEPDDGMLRVLAIELKVDRSLEPTWQVVTDDQREPIRISSAEREMFGLGRIGSFTDKHTTWGRGSALARLTGDAASIRVVLSEANRQARNAVRDHVHEKLASASQKVQTAAKKVGVKPRMDLKPGLDLRSMHEGSASLTLHDGDIPIRQSGLGTRRLLVAEIQKEATANVSITLYDEVEHGLEPFRVRHLVRTLQNNPKLIGHSGQVFFTSHSSVAVEEIDAENLYVIRSVEGETTVGHVGSALQALVRRVPEAILSRNVLVCEGETEEGFCRALDAFWSRGDRSSNFAYRGTSVVSGGGGEAAGTARSLATLGFRVCYFGDSDQSLSPSQSDLEELGVRVIVWDGSSCTEDRLFLDLPTDGLQELIDLATEIRDCSASIVDATQAQLPQGSRRFTGSVSEWTAAGCDLMVLRSALGSAAHKKDWYKRITYGELVGRIVVKHLGALGSADLGKKINAIKSWGHGE